MRRISGVFIETLETAMTQLRSARDRGDLQGARRAAHDIKNCFGLLQAGSAVADALALEELNTLDAQGAPTALFERLERHARDACRFVERLALASD